MNRIWNDIGKFWWEKENATTDRYKLERYRNKKTSKLEIQKN